MLRFRQVSRNGAFQRAAVPAGKDCGTGVFDGRSPLGLLSVVIDEAGLTDDRSPAERLVRGLCSSELVARWFWDGTTSEVQGEDLEELALAEPGLIRVGPRRDGVRQVTRAPSVSTVIGTGIVGNRPEVAASDDSSASYLALGPSERAERRRADGFAYCVADAIDADLIITRREYLLERRGRNHDVIAATPEEALPLIGLYLRTQGSFVTWRSEDGTFTSKLDRDLFFHVGARELLPASWRWFSACVQSATRNGTSAPPDELAYVARSAWERVQRALEARDRVLVALNQTQNPNSQSEAMASLDFLLLSLMGAFDASARVAHTVLGLPDDDLFNAGWQKTKRWVKDVKKEHAGLGAVAGQPANQEVIKIVADLRNTIHGASLRGVMFRTGSQSQLLVGLDAGTSAVDQMRRSKDPAAWGLLEIGGAVFLDPLSFVDHVITSAVSFLNEVMNATPVETLPGVTQPDQGPPDDDRMYDQRTRESVRALLGFS